MNTILIASALVIAAPGLKDPPKKASGIVGVWTVESLSMAGKNGKVAQDMRYEFTADGQWIIHREGAAAGKSTPRSYTVDAKASPATIDVTNAAGVYQLRGIFKVDGDTLTMCYGFGDDGRPKSFEPADGARQVLMVLKRVQK